MDIGVVPEDLNQYGFIPRRIVLAKEANRRWSSRPKMQQHHELTKRIRRRALQFDDEQIPSSFYVQYRRDDNHETRVVVPFDSLEYVSKFKLLSDDESVSIPPGICVACTHKLCWFHEPGASDTYHDLLYELGDAMDKGECSMEEFYWRMEFFYQVKGLDRDLRARPNGVYPHRRILRSKRVLCTIYPFIAEILVCAPKGLIRHMVNQELIPSKEAIEHHKDNVIRTACGNPDPNASVLQYLVEDARLVTFVPDSSLLAVARTERTIRFLLRMGCNCKGKESETQFVIYHTPPGEKANILRALFEYGADFPLVNWSFIDLDSFKVVQRFRPRNEVVSWIEGSRLQICNEIRFHTTLWPYLCLQYGFQFTAEEIICSLLCSKRYGDFEEEVFTTPGFVLTHKCIRDHFHLQMVEVEWFFQRLATIINYNKTPIPFAIAPNLSILDKHLIWMKHTTKYFSHALKRRLFTLLCVFRRQFGSTLLLKRILPQIVPRMVSDAPYETEEEENSFCQIQ